MEMFGNVTAARLTPSEWLGRRRTGSRWGLMMGQYGVEYDQPYIGDRLLGTPKEIGGVGDIEYDSGVVRK